MQSPPPTSISLSPQVARALRAGDPIVALESAVVTHGLPRPTNLELAEEMENQVRSHGAVPATVAVLEGRIRVGLNSDMLERLARGENLRKVSSRDLGIAVAQKASGGTTVAGTLLAAERAGLRVFATGGIGGVHRQAPLDISADLRQLARSPLVVVCAGAKAILDLPATLEALETLGVPVVGYQTDEFPAFYSRSSGLPLGAQAQNPEQIAEIARAHWALGASSALLVAVPPPEEVALPRQEIEVLIEQASGEAQERQVRGQGVTPFMLQRVDELSAGKALRANLGLLKNNARLAARIARHLRPQGRQHLA